MNCQHVGCRCQVESADGYCCEYCREHGTHAEGADDHACECGHDPCMTAAAV
jgi:hypothetical protein